MQILITKNSLIYDVSKYVIYPVFYNDDISKILDTAQFVIPQIPFSIAPTTAGASLDMRTINKGVYNNWRCNKRVLFKRR